MRHLSKRIIFLCGLFVMPAFASETQETPVASPSEVLQGYLAKYPGIMAEFVQTTYSKDREIVQEVAGNLWVVTPDKFKIESGIPANQILVSDGKLFWNYDADLEQVIISALDASRIPILLLARHEEDLSLSYLIDTFSDETSSIFVLSPRSADDPLVSLNLEFINEKPVALLIRDTMGQSTHVAFNSLKSFENPNEEFFRFFPPPGTDIIEDE